MSGVRKSGSSMDRRSILIAMAALSGATVTGQVQAQSAWPSKQVRIIVPAPPGGNPDVLGRLLALKFSEAFGKPFVVENITGGGTTIAANTVARSAPDGHTLLFGDSGSLAIAPALMANLPYHPLKDFTPVTSLAAVPTLLMLIPSVPANTLEEFIRYAKANPGKVSFGTAGVGSIHHLTMTIFAGRAGIELLHVPYKGGSQLTAALLAGDIQAAFIGIPNAVQPLKSGRLKTLGISTLARSKVLPDAPTMAESGVPGFDVASTMGVVAAAGTPPDIVAKLQAATAKGMREPDVAERIATLGMIPTENGTAHYAQFLREDVERYANVVKAMGLKSE